MNTEDTQKPAFPCDWICADSMGQQVVREQHFGLTIRDYFAAKAMNGMICQIFSEAAKSRKDPDEVAKVLAHASYRMADAMIKEGGKP